MFVPRNISPPFDFVDNPVTKGWPAIWSRGRKVRQTTSIVYRGVDSPQRTTNEKTNGVDTMFQDGTQQVSQQGV